ncbi:MAG: DUF4868 domain-containing protein [Nanoarchaeota archaeon]|nr:DUF4868 domain-containing protein [Nanoarchaeota archaeon]MBU1321908.1 DUF4868 domain-containing protein [Nanoarchaeota archaeon]MBU1598431.1 DUF4868 domain-containing protein [Nanoarchaeota archaeon]MBU2441057.1 DUF4868 domain-containing protein [Nanoarchaeota archaeon]
MIKNKKEYFNKLLSLLKNKELAVSILFVTRSKEDDSYEIHKGNLSDELSKILRELCLRISEKSYSNPEKKSFAPYDPSQKGSNCTEYIEGPELDQIQPILNTIDGTPYDLKKLDKKFLSNLWFYVIHLSDGKKEVLFFKKYSQGMVLTKGWGLAWTFKSGNFDKIKKDTFIIPDKSDCVLFDNNLIIRSKGNFEKIFNFIHLIEENAKAAIKFIEEKLPFKIDNFDKIKTGWMEHEQKVRKLNNIYSTKILEKIKPESIQVLIKAGILNTVTTKKDKDGTLIVSSTDPWEILHILDDDYVKSLLTGIDYEAPHKKRIKK